ncbi:MAG: RND transporter, partial [Bacteroidetes bacterium]
MSPWFSRMLFAVLRYRWWWAVVLLIATLFGAYQTATQLRIDNSVSIWFLEDNPAYRSYLDFQHERGSDEIVIVMWSVDSALDRKHQQLLRQLHAVVDSLPGVHATFSLANARYPVYAGRRLFYRPIYAPGRTAEQVDRLLRELPAIRHQLIGPEGKHLFFYVQLDPTDELEAARNTIVSGVAAAITTRVPAACISGQPILNEAFNASIYQESTFFATATVVVIFVLLFFLLPHWYYLPIALASVVVPTSILMGSMMTLGYSLNLISMLIPTILMVYSVSDAVHIINIFSQEAQRSPTADREQLIAQALWHSLRPCFYTTLTTVIGYLALIRSPLPAFQIMGLFTFVGMTMAFVVVYLITTIGFSMLPHISALGIKGGGQATAQRGLLQAMVNRINGWTSQRAGLILGTAALLGVLGLASLTRLEVNTDSLHLLGEGPAKADLYTIEEVLGGNARFQLNIAHRQDSSMLQRAVLDSLAAFQAFVEQHPQLATPVSLINFRNFLQARSNPLAIFNPINTADLLALTPDAEPAFFSLIAPDQSALSISVHVRELETRQLERLLDE